MGSSPFERGVVAGNNSTFAIKAALYWGKSSRTLPTEGSFKCGAPGNCRDWSLLYDMHEFGGS